MPNFSYYSPISINAAQVPTTQTDFPVLVSQTDNRFKTVGNGGHVQNSSGFDIRPYTNSTLSTPITGYELDFYDGVNGILNMWVKVSSLSSSTTPFVLAYGNPSLTIDGSSTSTWSNGFISVFHLKDGTTLSVADSTGNHNGTNHSVTAASGQIDGAGSFASASSQFIGLGTFTGPTSITYSAWVNATSFPNAANIIVGRDNTNGDGGFSFLKVKSTGKLGCSAGVVGPLTVSYDGTGTNTLSTATWYYLTMTYSGTATTAALIGYVNASVDASVNNGSPVNLVTFTEIANIGQLGAATPNLFWNGKLDEVRIASVARSADWITTEYNNQSAPGTFETLGSEASVIFSGLFTFIPPPVGIGTQTDTDNFNRADASPMAGNWTEAQTLPVVFDISSNTVIPHALGTDIVAFWGIWSHGNDQYSQAKITVVGSGAQTGLGVVVRKSTTAATQTFYRAVINDAGAIDVLRFNAGSATSITTRSVTYSAGTQLGLSIQGSTLKIWYGGVQQGASVVDGSPIASGSPGLGYSSTSTSGSIDDWDAGTVP